MMLQKMREQTQGLGFKIVVGLLVFVLAVFGFGGFNLFAGGDPQVASVNGSDITQAQLMNEAQREQQRMAARFGPDFDPSLIDPATLQAQVLNRLISQELLSQKAEALGLGAARGLVDQSIIDNPNFQLDGQFHEETYRRTVRLLGFSPQGFVDETRRALKLEQLSTSVTNSALLPEWELRSAAVFLGQKRDLAYLAFEPESFAKTVTVSDEDVERHYEEHQSQYMTAETVNAQYVSLSWRDLANDPSIVVEEEAVVAVYEADKAAAADNQEQRDSSHILLRVTDERDEEATREALQQIAADVAAGADFNAIAQERSEDPGSKLQGGSLGPIGKGVFDPAFEEALWALDAPGDLSEPVKSAFGYHLIRLDEIKVEPVATLDERRAEIEEQLREEQARALFDARFRELDNLAFENPDSLTPVAEALGLTLQSAAGVTENTGPDVFAEAEVRTALFSSEVLDDSANSAALQLEDDRAVVVRAQERFAPEQRPLADVAEEIKSTLTQESAQSALTSAFNEALEAVRAGTAVGSVAAQHSLQWQRFAAVTQSGTEGVPSTVRTAAFDLPAPTVAEKSVGRAELPGGGLAVVTVTRVVPGDWASMSEVERDGLQRYMADRTSRLDFVSMYLSLEEEAKIVRPEGV